MRNRKRSDYRQPEETPDPSACATPVDGRLTAAILAYDQADYEESFPLFWELADEGNAYAQYFVGESYKYGYGVEGSSEKCVYWYMTSRQMATGTVRPAWALAIETDTAWAPIMKRMLYWYALSAQQANPSGLINLGYCYHKGIGVEVIWKRRETFTSWRIWRGTRTQRRDLRK